MNKTELNTPNLRVALLLNKKMYERTFAPDAVARLDSFADIVGNRQLPESIDESYVLDQIPSAEAVITCWGTPRLEAQVLSRAPNLKLIAHAAGTPKAIINERDWPVGVRVFTAAPIIAIDVAETALWGMIELLKRMGDFDRGMRNGEWFTDLLSLKDVTRRLNYRLSVGIVSASLVGRNMIRLLHAFGVKISLYDPYVSKEEATELGVNKESLASLFSSSDVVSIHAPSLPETQGLIDEVLIKSLKDGAVFVNTSRGAIVDEPALTEELKTGRICAYLDVFREEPLPLTSEIYNLPNVKLSPHMSGGHTINGGFERGDYIVQQLFTYHTQGSLLHEVTEDSIKIMA